MSVDASRQVIKRPPRATRVKAIVEAARSLFEEKGYEAALISEIAERAGVDDETIYRYFDTKLDLFDAAVIQMLSDFDTRLSIIHGTWNRLRFIVSWQLEVMEKHPEMLRQIHEELRHREEYRSAPMFVLQGDARRTVDTFPIAMKAGQSAEAAGSQKHSHFATYLQRLSTELEPLATPCEARFPAARESPLLPEPLSAMETRVLQLLAEGYSNRALTEKLFVADSTIRTHLRSINAKLGANNRTQAVALGRRHGLIRATFT